MEITEIASSSAESPSFSVENLFDLSPGSADLKAKLFLLIVINARVSPSSK